MAYIGSKPNDTRQLARREFSYAVTVASTTTFTGSDAGGKTLSYQPGELEVYMNGVRLDPADYTATTGSSVVLGSGANIGDNINIFAGQTLPTDDYVSKTAGGTFDGDVLFNTTNTLPAINNVEGVAISAGSYGGRFEVSRNSNEAVAFNRMNTDGNILAIKKDGTTVGSIGVIDGNNTFLQGATGHAGIAFVTNNVVPFREDTYRDNTLNLGQGDVRWKDLYLSGGVYLGGTGSANKLDDYEEGTWTPAFQNVSLPSYTVQTGVYTKIGKIVHVSIIIEYSGLNTGDASSLSINLPFTASATGVFHLAEASNNTGFNGTNTISLIGSTGAGSSTFAFGSTGEYNDGDYDSGNWNQSGGLRFAGYYPTS